MPASQELEMDKKKYAKISLKVLLRLT